MMEEADDLTHLVRRLTPEEKEQGLRVVLAHMRKSPRTYERGEVSLFFAALTSGIGSASSKATWDDLLSIATESESFELKNKCYALLTQLAEQSEGELVNERWALVMQLAINPFERRMPSDLAVKLATALSPKLDNGEANKAATVLLFMMKTSEDSSAVESVADIISILSDRLSKEHADSLIKAIFEILRQSNERYRRQAAAHSLNAKGWGKSIQRLGYLNDSVDRALDHLRYAHDGTDTRESASDYLQFLTPDVRKVVALKVFQDELDHANRHSTQEVTFTTASGVTLPLSRYVNLKQLSFEIDEPLEIAKLLSHPHCVDDPRNALVDRMEAIVYHNGEIPEPAPAPGPAINPTLTPPAASISQFGDVHFGSQFDVAKWIEENHPQFDLDSNMRIESREPSLLTHTR